MKVKTKPGETVTFQPEVIDPMSIFVPLLSNRLAARKTIKVKIGKATFNCFLWSLTTSSGRVTIGIQATGAPVIKENAND